MTGRTGAASLTASDIMTSNPVRVTPDTTATELGRLLDTNDISGVPVVDALDRVIGVVSKTDLLHRCVRGPVGTNGGSFLTNLEEGLGARLEPDALGVVEDFMNTDSITAGPNDAIGDLARRMVEDRVHRIIIIDDQRHVLGIVTSLDLLGKFHS